MKQDQTFNWNIAAQFNDSDIQAIILMKSYLNKGLNSIENNTPTSFDPPVDRIVIHEVNERVLPGVSLSTYIQIITDDTNTPSTSVISTTENIKDKMNTILDLRSELNQTTSQLYYTTIATSALISATTLKSEYSKQYITNASSYLSLTKDESKLNVSTTVANTNNTTQSITETLSINSLTSLIP